ncbi:MAG: hypothetical protein NTX52_01200 [Planctomycetota bacterium]|nr:hypothetical protein [Planctomycetota bacterium]
MFYLIEIATPAFGWFAMTIPRFVSNRTIAAYPPELSVTGAFSNYRKTQNVIPSAARNLSFWVK